MISRFILVLIILLTFYSCKKDKVSGNIQTDTALADSLRLTPTALQIGNDSLFLTTYVWRDFMPTTGKDGSVLYCSNQLTYKDSLPIPAGLEFKTQYVISGNQVWTNEHVDIDSGNPYVIRGVINGGPKWEPGIFVDVVCEFEISNQTYRIIVKQQKINATY